MAVMIPGEHFPAKWEPVRRRKCDHWKNFELTNDYLPKTRAGAAAKLGQVLVRYLLERTGKTV